MTTFTESGVIDMYDYLVVGAGLFGATFAQRMSAAGKKVLVVDKRGYLGGNCADEKIHGITVHRHGAHIFHTNNKRVWDYVNSFVEFMQFQNNVKAKSFGKMYSLPFNMNTFYEMYGFKQPEEVKEWLRYNLQKIEEPKNLEEQAISQVGPDIFEKLVKYYTEKQWGRSCKELPASIIKRLPIRLTFDNNYFNDCYQGLPSIGYTALVEKLLMHCEVKCFYYFESIEDWRKIARKLVYTGPIDAFFDYKLGKLDWRTLTFDTRLFDVESYQGCPVINHCDNTVSYTRTIEHKHFLKEKLDDPHTIVTFEYPKAYEEGDEQYYTVPDERNTKLAIEYRKLASQTRDVIFGGRLGLYRYLNMDEVIEQALREADEELSHDGN